MTRIIDSDALIATLLHRRPSDDDKGVGRPEFRTFVDGCVQLLDAAPTLLCDGCKSYRPWTATGSPDFCCCGNEVMDGAMDDEGHNPPRSFCCNRYEPRNP